MVFVILGNQKFNFDRLIYCVEKLCENKIIIDDVIIQTGYNNYSSKYFSAIDFVDKVKFDELIKEARLIITHGGTGSILNSIQKDKKIIAIPRQEKYNEHIDNHQQEIVSTFTQKGFILSSSPVYKELKEIVLSLNSFKPTKFLSNNLKFNKELIKLIDDF